MVTALTENLVSLYFHIPFCTRKCPYCHFYVVKDLPAHHPLLAEGLELEWAEKLPLLQGSTIASIYFGGGTPTLFGPAQIGRILERARELPWTDDCEITIEANPEDATVEFLLPFRTIGVNRLSIGIQSLDDRSLQTLERIHTAKRGKEAIFAAAKAGFDNLSIDLMFDLPGQTEASWRYTLDQIQDLPIAHLSLYNLTFEPHTSFYKRKESLQPLVPSQESSVQMWEAAIHTLERMGLSRYEISAFSRPEKRSKHNCGYWTGRPFLGFGPSAFSYWEGKRFSNAANLNRYTQLLKKGKSAVDFEEALPYPDNLNERLAVELRLLEGVDLSRWDLPSKTLATLERLTEEGLLLKKNNRLRLSERGLLFYDSVAVEII